MNVSTTVAMRKTWPVCTLAVAVAAALLLLGGCQAEKKKVEESNAGPPTWTELQAGLFTTSCAVSSCHQPVGTQAPSFAADQYDTLLGSSRNYVIPDDSANSLLFQKVNTGGTMAGYAGAAGAQDIEDWIDAGAPEN